MVLDAAVSLCSGGNRLDLVNWTASYYTPIIAWIHLFETQQLPYIQVLWTCTQPATFCIAYTSSRSRTRETKKAGLREGSRFYINMRSTDETRHQSHTYLYHFLPVPCYQSK